MRILWLFILVFVFQTPVIGASSSDSSASTQRWVLSAIRDEINGSVDLNKIASLLYPLTSASSSLEDESVRQVLSRVSDYLQSVDVAALSCKNRSDYYLSTLFLAQAGWQIDSKTTLQDIWSCTKQSTRFTLTNMLFLVCRFTPLSHEQSLPSGLSRLKSFQRRDGAFISENGQPWFYLTSHALLAMFYCEGNTEAVSRAQDRLISLLQEFAQVGFQDGLVEILVFLKLTGRTVPNLDQYIHQLETKQRADGSLCFYDRANCQGHWHTTSLFLELLNIKKSTY